MVGSVFKGACEDLEKILFLISQIASSASGWFCYMCSICLEDMENLVGEKWKGQNCFPSSTKCLKMTSHVKSRARIPSVRTFPHYPGTWHSTFPSGERRNCLVTPWLESLQGWMPFTQSLLCTTSVRFLTILGEFN